MKTLKKPISGQHGTKKLFKEYGKKVILFALPPKQIKEAGGRREGEKKLWETPYKEVIKLGLKNRIINVRDRKCLLLGTFVKRIPL